MAVKLSAVFKESLIQLGIYNRIIIRRFKTLLTEILSIFGDPFTIFIPSLSIKMVKQIELTSINANYSHFLIILLIFFRNGIAWSKIGHISVCDLCSTHNLFGLPLCLNIFSNNAKYLEVKSTNSPGKIMHFNKVIHSYRGREDHTISSIIFLWNLTSNRKI